MGGQQPHPENKIIHPKSIIRLINAYIHLQTFIFLSIIFLNQDLFYSPFHIAQSARFKSNFNPLCGASNIPNTAAPLPLMLA